MKNRPYGEIAKECGLREKTLKQQFLENFDVALFPIERPDFFLNIEEYFDIMIKMYLKTTREWLEQKLEEVIMNYPEDYHTGLLEIKTNVIDKLLEDLNHE